MSGSFGAAFFGDRLIRQCSRHLRRDRALGERSCSLIGGSFTEISCRSFQLTLYGTYHFI